MNHHFLLCLCLLLPALPAPAADIDLSSKIAPGKWAMAYQREGEIKLIHLRHHEQGVSYTCIKGDPRTMIVNWLSKKGCTIQKESMEGGVYRLSGACKLKWWPGAPIPARVTLRPENRQSFTLDIRTAEHTLLSYRDHTQATFQGSCDPAKPATAQQRK